MKSPRNFKEWMRTVDRKNSVAERRPPQDPLAGFANQATLIDDWNGDQAALTGFYQADASTTSNAPDTTSQWVGWVIGTDGTTVTQHVIAINDTTPPREYVRRGYDPGLGAPRAFDPWSLVGGLHMGRPGTIHQWLGATAPLGTLLLDGTNRSRTAYPRLYAEWTTTYGPGDGSTTFGTPDFRSRVPVGYLSGDSDFGTLAATGGEKTHTLTTGELAVHTHGYTDPSHAHGIQVGNTNGGLTAGTNRNIQQNSGTVAGTSQTATTGIIIANAGSGTPHNNLQPFIVVNYVVAY